MRSQTLQGELEDAAEFHIPAFKAQRVLKSNSGETKPLLPPLCCSDTKGFTSPWVPPQLLLRVQQDEAKLRCFIPEL